MEYNLAIKRNKSQYVDLKKIAQHERYKLSFIGGKMRTIALERAAQIALRNCSNETVGKMGIN